MATNFNALDAKWSLYYLIETLRTTPPSTTESIVRIVGWLFKVTEEQIHQVVAVPLFWLSNIENKYVIRLILIAWRTKLMDSK